MHIWYVNHYAGGPGIGAAYRPYHLSRAWQKLGHTATVFVASFHHHLFTDTKLDSETIVDGVRYISIPVPSYQGNGIARLANMAAFARGLSKLSRRVPRDLPKPDAIIASSPHIFPIYPAHTLAKHFGAKLVFEIRDIWPLSITVITGTSRLHPFVQLCAAAERYAYRHSNLVTSVLPRADRYLAAAGWGDKPFVWVPNGVGETAGEPTTVRSPDAAKLVSQIQSERAAGRVVLVHPGSMGPPNGLIPLMDAVTGPDAASLAGKLAIVLVGAGPLEAELRQRAQNAAVPVLIGGRVAKDDVAAIVAASDFGYAGVNNIEQLYQYGLSLNKFSDYLLERVPVFLPVAPCGDPVSEAGAGLVRPVNSVSDMRAALQELVALPVDERKAMGERGRAYMLAEYDYLKIARRYAEAIAKA
jgi:glycosyltransferase involved in cell wall biosynthesis